jgi:hypothetical protein
MTSISSLSSGADVTALTQAAATQRQRPKPPDMTNTAKALGLSADDLQSELKSGKTLDAIAQDKGVSSDDLLSAVKTDLQANKPADAPELSDDQLTQMATAVAAGQGPGGPGGPGGAHHHHGGGGGQATASILGTSASDTSSNLSSLADALGTTSDDLLSQLTSGNDLSSLFGQSSSATWTSSGASTSGLAVDMYA